MKPRPAAYTLITVTSLLVSCAGLEPGFAPTKDKLERRVLRLYHYFDKGNFAEAWEMFDAGIQRDTPRAKYISQTKEAYKRVILERTPEVSLEIDPPTGELIGKVKAYVSIQAPNGRWRPTAVHETTWVWSKTQWDTGTRRVNTGEWFLARHVRMQKVEGDLGKRN